MNLTNEQVQHGIKLLDRLISASESTKEVLSTIEGKESITEELTKNEVVFMYLLFQLETLKSND
jgi:hypothetical protein